MKRLLTLIVLTILFTYSVSAQPGCPSVNAGPDVTVDCNNPCTNLTASCLATGATTTYTASSIPYNPPYAYNSGTPILVNIDDTWSGVISLPFTFCYYGNSYNQIVCGSNGVISFNTSYANGFCAWSYSASIPSSSLFLNTIFGPYHDIDPSVSGNMYYAILGTYPCRTFVVSWYNVAMYSCTSLKATHMIVLYESTNVIEVYMQNKPTCASWNSGNTCIGVQNAAGTTGVAAPGRNTGVWTTSNEAWRFTPSGSPNYTLSWWQGSTQIGTGASVNVCPTSNTVYTAQIVYDLCTGNTLTLTDNVTVNSNGASTVTVTPTSATICAGQSVSLNASGGVSYTWAPAAGLSATTGPNVTASPTTTTTYTLTGVSSNGCTANIPITITVTPLPTSGFTVSSPNCIGNNATVTYTGSAGSGASYNWGFSGGTATPGTGQGPHNVHWSAPGTYNVSLTVTENNCTSLPANQTVVVDDISNIAVSPVTSTQCLGAGVVLNASGASTYSWSPAAGLSATTGSSVTATPQSTTVYTITATTTTGCTGTVTATVNVNPIPTSDFTFSSPNCNGNTATITYSGTASPSASYSWNFSGGAAVPGTGQGPHQVQWPASGTYNVSCTVTENGCTSTQTLHAVPVSNISTQPHTQSNVLCFGGNTGSATVYPVNGSAPYGYIWSTSPPQTGSTALNLAAGTYYVSITDNAGCVTYDTVIITQPPLMVIQSNFSDEGCTGSCNGSVTVTVNGGVLPYTYVWSNSSSTTNTALNLCTGPYSVTVTDSNHCTVNASATIGTNSPLLVDAEASAYDVLIGDQVYFYYTGSGAANFLWDFGDGNTSALMNPSHIYSAQGQFMVKLVANSGAPDYCEDSVILYIIVVQPSSVVIPNFFSPNNDGHNDIFTLEAIGLESEEMMIYNRWGKLIFEWNAIGGSWDGHGKNGHEESDGTYYYIFYGRGFDRVEYKLNGTVTLMR